METSIQQQLLSGAVNQDKGKGSGKKERRIIDTAAAFQRIYDLYGVIIDSLDEQTTDEALVEINKHFRTTFTPPPNSIMYYNVERSKIIFEPMLNKVSKGAEQIAYKAIPIKYPIGTSRKSVFKFTSSVTDVEFTEFEHGPVAILQYDEENSEDDELVAMFGEIYEAGTDAIIRAGLVHGAADVNTKRILAQAKLKNPVYTPVEEDGTRKPNSKLTTIMNFVNFPGSSTNVKFVNGQSIDHRILTGTTAKAQCVIKIAQIYVGAQIVFKIYLEACTIFKLSQSKGYMETMDQQREHIQGFMPGYASIPMVDIKTSRASDASKANDVPNQQTYDNMYIPTAVSIQAQPNEYNQGAAQFNEYNQGAAQFNEYNQPNQSNQGAAQPPQQYTPQQLPSQHINLRQNANNPRSVNIQPSQPSQQTPQAEFVQPAEAIQVFMNGNKR